MWCQYLPGQTKWEAGKGGWVPAVITMHVTGKLYSVITVWVPASLIP